jgi:hydroxymethylglutaryl-CoA lyase
LERRRAREIAHTLGAMSEHSPQRVRIREVGPRDGFQNEPEQIATADKIRLINSLAQTGLKRLEVASFVRPDVLPQLADAVEVLHGIDVPDDVALTVLVPNERGLHSALQHRECFDEVVLFVSASETHNRENVNRDVEHTLASIARMVPQVHEAGLRCSAVIATAFGCAYEGLVKPSRVVSLGKRLAAFGIEELGLGDTTGMANPLQVRELFDLLNANLHDIELTAHFHNTRGQGLANAFAAWQAGVESFESSFGELGGCPVPAGSTGNVASEDLVSMFQEMGVDTGIDINALVCASLEVQEILGRPLTSHVLVAGPVDWSGS